MTLSARYLVLITPLIHAITQASATDTPLTREQAGKALEEDYQSKRRALELKWRQAAKEKVILRGEHTLRWTETYHGQRGDSGWPLWISLHGGGEVPTPVNDEQWSKHAFAYTPASGIYLTPRAPSDTWFMWNEPHVDPLLEDLLEAMIASADVDPNKIYLLGYSAGGNGVYHLASRMADRFAAASAMAGYPSGAPLAPLRNLPFGIFVGEHDITFDRVKHAQTWQKELAAKRAADPDAYPHWVKIYPDLGHWLRGKDAEALPWMAAYQRNPWPRKVIWVQDSVPHSRFYWLQIDFAEAKAGRTIESSVQGQTITIEGELPNTITIWLSDALLDLDLPVKVASKGRIIYEGKVERTRDAIRSSLDDRMDRPATATARLNLTNIRTTLERE